ncbi:MAG: ATP-dependent sacrificial sulfur transferase LarE [Oscillospiraceae bacterium]|nr:ATP-dependent sacrificial sulfur transferase LarE [Oscillospiraceae bacterium]
MTIQDFFSEHPKAALAFSGGVDSAYLLYAGIQAGADIRPYYAKSQFQPQFEYEDAMRLCRELGAEPRVLRLDALCSKDVARNGPDRCYHCKINIMSTVLKAAAEDGYPVLLDGTNASDDAGDRPGMRALRELEILSPLRLCGLTKPEIRRRSREAGLFTWNKPAYACLATRVKTGELITNERLAAIEESEDYLFSKGYTDFRVRTMGKAALLQFPAEQLEKAKSEETEIVGRLRAFFESISIDPRGRTKGL